MFRWLTEKLKQRKAQRVEQTRRAVEEFRQRLANPDFDLVRRRFGAPISESLQRLYSDPLELSRDCVEKKYGSDAQDVIFVAWYIPLDEQAFSEQWNRDDRRFDFADDGTASRYTVDPTDNDAEVFYFRHEDQTLHSTGVKLRDFLDLPEA